jgi:hypothetical protein
MMRKRRNLRTRFRRLRAVKKSKTLTALQKIVRAQFKRKLKLKRKK